MDRFGTLRIDFVRAQVLSFAVGTRAIEAMRFAVTGQALLGNTAIFGSLCGHFLPVIGSARRFAGFLPFTDIRRFREFRIRFLLSLNSVSIGTPNADGRALGFGPIGWQRAVVDDALVIDPFVDTRGLALRRDRVSIR